MDAMERIQATKERAKRAYRKMIHDSGFPDIVWIVDCPLVEQAIWCDFWEGKFPQETEESLKWALGLPAQERDAQLGILRRISVGEGPVLRPSGHPGSIVEAFLSPGNERAIALVTLARIMETRRGYIQARLKSAATARHERQRAKKRAAIAVTLPGIGFSDTPFGRICARIARDITGH